MFTICPKCTKQFQIFAEHIAAASGEVRCGFCNTQFNALRYLNDEPLSTEKISTLAKAKPELGQELVIEPDALTPEQAEVDIIDANQYPANEINVDSSEQLIDEEPEFNIGDEERVGAETIEIELPDNGLLNTIDEGNSEAILTSEPEVEVSETDAPELPQAETDVVITNTEQDSGLELDTAINEIGVGVSAKESAPEAEKESIELYVSDTEYDFPEAEEILTETATRRSWVATFFWTSASVFGLIVITTQLVWFNRDQVLLKYPELTPYMKLVCKEFDCRIIRQRDTSAIKLVNRDVRLHPSYRDTLLVNATMSNELAIHQPYPKVQLTLFDTSGSLLGYREFKPDDYLDESIDIEAGMPVDNPVHFVLEVSGPTAGAVSFEFRFL